MRYGSCRSVDTATLPMWWPPGGNSVSDEP